MTDIDLSTWSLEDICETWERELVQVVRDVNVPLVASLELEAARRGVEIESVFSAITAATWDPDLHPRGKDGKFIELLGIVELVGLAFNGKDGKMKSVEGRRGKVMAINPDPKNPGKPKIRVALLDKDGKPSVVIDDVKPDQIIQAPEKARLDAPDKPAGDAPDVNPDADIDEAIAKWEETGDPVDGTDAANLMLGRGKERGDSDEKIRSDIGDVFGDAVGQLDISDAYKWNVEQPSIVQPDEMDNEFEDVQGQTMAKLEELGLTSDYIDEDVFDDFFVEAMGVMEDPEVTDKDDAIADIAGAYGVKPIDSNDVPDEMADQVADELDAEDGGDAAFEDMQNQTAAKLQELGLAEDTIDEDTFADLFVDAMGVLEDDSIEDKDSAIIEIARDYGIDDRVQYEEDDDPVDVPAQDLAEKPVIMETGFRMQQQGAVDDIKNEWGASPNFHDGGELEDAYLNFERQLDEYRDTMTGGRLNEVNEAKGDLVDSYYDVMDSEGYTELDDDVRDSFQEMFEIGLFEGDLNDFKAPVDEGVPAPGGVDTGTVTRGNIYSMSPAELKDLSAQLGVEFVDYPRAPGQTDEEYGKQRQSAFEAVRNRILEKIALDDAGLSPDGMTPIDRKKAVDARFGPETPPTNYGVGYNVGVQLAQIPPGTSPEIRDIWTRSAIGTAVKNATDPLVFDGPNDMSNPNVVARANMSLVNWDGDYNKQLDEISQMANDPALLQVISDARDTADRLLGGNNDGGGGGGEWTMPTGTPVDQIAAKTGLPIVSAEQIDGGYINMLDADGNAVAYTDTGDGPDMTIRSGPAPGTTEAPGTAESPAVAEARAKATPETWGGRVAVFDDTGEPTYDSEKPFTVWVTNEDGSKNGGRGSFATREEAEAYAAETNRLTDLIEGKGATFELDDDAAVARILELDAVHGGKVGYPDLRGFEGQERDEFAELRGWSQGHRDLYDRAMDEKLANMPADTETLSPQAKAIVDDSIFDGYDVSVLSKGQGILSEEKFNANFDNGYYGTLPESDRASLRQALIDRAAKIDADYTAQDDEIAKNVLDKARAEAVSFDDAKKGSIVIVNDGGVEKPFKVTSKRGGKLYGATTWPDQTFWEDGARPEDVVSPGGGDVDAPEPEPQAAPDAQVTGPDAGFEGSTVKLLDGADATPNSKVINVKDGKTYTIEGVYNSPSLKQDTYVRLRDADGKLSYKSKRSLKAAPDEGGAEAPVNPSQAPSAPATSTFTKDTELVQALKSLVESDPTVADRVAKANNSLKRNDVLRAIMKEQGWEADNSSINRVADNNMAELGKLAKKKPAAATPAPEAPAGPTLDELKTQLADIDTQLAGKWGDQFGNMGPGTAYQLKKLQNDRKSVNEKIRIIEKQIAQDEYDKRNQPRAADWKPKKIDDPEILALVKETDDALWQNSQEYDNPYYSTKDLLDTRRDQVANEIAFARQFVGESNNQFITLKVPSGYEESIPLEVAEAYAAHEGIKIPASPPASF